MRYIFLMVTVAVLAGESDAARILGLFNYPGKSHFLMFEEVMKALAARGHEVFVYSHFPQAKPLPNYTDVSLVGSLPPVVNAIPMDEVFGRDDPSVTFGLLRGLSEQACEKLLQFPAMQKLMKTHEKYDLIFTEPFTTDCLLPFVYKFQAPNIALLSSVVMPWTPDRFGLPDNPSYIPIQFLRVSDHMSFFERLRNLWYTIYSKWFFIEYMDKPANTVVKKYFGDSLPPLQEIAKNTSMLFINTHPALNPPRPLVPAVVEVGGIHIKPAKKLPKDIQEFIDGAEHGVIFFTFGSTVTAKDLSENKRKAILEAFAELPQRVLWKWETDELPGKPPNVMARKWLPQFDVLSHPKTRLFITHGGLLGTMEAVYSGVPMLAIPLFGDQPSNVMMCVRRGIARMLPFPEISKELLLQNIREMINDSGYKQRIVEVSEAFKDRPMSPQEAVVYWSEYVIRHKGARHLRSAAVDLQWYQLLLLDVLAVVLVGIAAVVAMVVVLLRLFLRKIGLLRKASPAEQPSLKTKKKEQ
ncbi:UDP-glycosyltransferase UGT5-like [Schistocerca serialis cubense]|uniref:UDP-glycosyltransferase UGT5-like n=1 Tax=Schistocerca serialis cubense TaxID=2023355 RepID=UPI00214E4392|nr:UDP-glycosyltransferase UGT5-like [Schistocerca serialis cubense]